MSDATAIAKELQSQLKQKEDDLKVVSNLSEQQLNAYNEVLQQLEKQRQNYSEQLNDLQLQLNAKEEAYNYATAKTKTLNKKVEESEDKIASLEKVNS